MHQAMNASWLYSCQNVFVTNGEWSDNTLTLVSARPALIKGLDERAAQALWNQQFASPHVKKDQVDAKSRDGQDIGKAIHFQQREPS